MKSRNVGHADWTQFYSVRERIVQGAKTGASEVLFVDCGGGIGHQAVRFREQFPDAPGRVVVQDLRQGLPAQAPDGVEVMEHDLFAEQPIKGGWCLSHSTAIAFASEAENGALTDRCRSKSILPPLDGTPVGERDCDQASQ